MREEDTFGEWFNRLILEAEIMDPRYPVKGLCVWLPYGMELRNRILSVIRGLLLEKGHREVLFPLLIPEDLFRKEEEHIRGFGEQVYWVTRGGGEELDVKLVLRPTSETAMYPMFSLWIRSHTDLPLKVFQVVSVFRYETKMTKPMIRMREVTTFKEAHTVHSSREEAEAQVKEAVSLYSRFFERLCLPYVVTRRPKWDTFAGADYSLAFDTLLPDGRVLQIGTVHFLGQNFSRVFEIKFQKPDGTHEYAHQTCYGISERVVAATLVLHADGVGPCLPPSVAPVQVVIVPIPFKEEKEPELFSEEVRKRLEEGGFRVVLDGRNLRPGNKFYYWERRGVPLRLEVGPRESSSRTVTLVRRDRKERREVPLEELHAVLSRTMEEMEEEMRRRAWEKMEGRIRRAPDLKGAVEAVREGGMARICFCGEECAGKAEEETGFQVLGEEVGGEAGKCALCGKPGRTFLMGKSY
ncbi:MAG: proline--tRNA ligase [Candidatus Hadarchaeales archaeon]